MKTAHVNRRKQQEPKSNKGWCDGCDSIYRTDNGKCPVCGHKDEHNKKMKKPVPTIEEFD